MIALIIPFVCIVACAAPVHTTIINNTTVAPTVTVTITNTSTLTITTENETKNVPASTAAAVTTTTPASTTETKATTELTTGGITIDGKFDDWNGIAPLITDPITIMKALYVTNDNTYLYFRLDFTGTNTANGDISLDLDEDKTPDHNIHIPSPSDSSSKPPALFTISGSNKEATFVNSSWSTISGTSMEFRFSAKDFTANSFGINEITWPQSSGASSVEEWKGYILYSVK